MGGMKGVNGCGQTAAQSGFRGLRGGGSWGTAAERRTGQRHGGRCLTGGGRSGENGQNLKMKKKARWSLAAVERKGMRSKPPRCPLGDGRPRGAEGRWGAATGSRDGLNRNLYEEISLLYVACGEKMRGRACRVGGAKPAAGVRLPKGAVARWTSRSVAEGCRNDRDDTPL